MASHNSTPESVLNAPSVTKEFVEGTEFSGLNRAQLRARAKALGYKFSGTPKGAGNLKTAPHWLDEVLRPAPIVEEDSTNVTDIVRANVSE